MQILCPVCNWSVQVGCDTYRNAPQSSGPRMLLSSWQGLLVIFLWPQRDNLQDWLLWTQVSCRRG